MERGRYTWDSQTGAFTSSVITDTNGEWGFSHGLAGVPGIIVSVGEEGFEFDIPGEGAIPFLRVARSDANPLVGGWWFRDLAIPGSIQEAGGDVIFAFLPDGRYFMCQDGDVENDESGQDGVEAGTITWNPSNGMFYIDFEADTNGEWGLSHTGPDPRITASADGNHLSINPDEPDAIGDEFVILHRIESGSRILSRWIGQQGLSVEDAGPNAAPFPDGLPNLIRYAMNLGSNPSPGQLPTFELTGSASASMATLLMAASDVGPGVILRYQQRFPLVGVSLVPQSSPDLVEWRDIPAAERTVTWIPIQRWSAFPWNFPYCLPARTRTASYG